MNKIYIVISLMLLPHYFLGQTDSSYSSELEEFVRTSGHLKNYNEAKNSYKINSSYKGIYQSQNLSDQLSLLFPIYIKNYGSGMNSGISMRGSGSEHTAVNWNGISINNPMLGVGSFSSLYLNFTDQIYVQPGGNSATGGSGAVGGSVNLDDQIYLTRAHLRKWNFNIGYGSFGNIYAQADFRQSNQQCANQLKVLYNSSENTFSYIDNQLENKVYKTNLGSPYKTIQLKWNTAIKINNRATFKAFQWFEYSNRNLQQGIGTMFSNQVQLERNYKALAQLEYKLNMKNVLSLKASFLRDYMQYTSLYFNNNNGIHRAIVDLTNIYKASSNLVLKYGFISQFYFLKTDAYGMMQKNENRTDAYVFTKYTYKKHTIMNANLRQPLVDGQVKPICVDLGYQRMFRTNKQHSFSYAQSFSQNYRLPTLNERFWQPGGNPQILPEISKSIEGTAKYTYSRKQVQNLLSATAYYNRIFNWIQWIPGSSGFWEARNTNKVLIKGIELNNELNVLHRQNIYSLRMNYSYNVSKNEATNQQLIYTPYNIINLTALVKYKDWIFTTNLHYTGFRYISTDNLYWLPAYQLLNLSVQRTIKIKKMYYNFSLLANNVFNTSFQTIENFAMPGRSFLFKVQLNN